MAGISDLLGDAPPPPYLGLLNGPLAAYMPQVDQAALMRQRGTAGLSGAAAGAFNASGPSAYPVSIGRVIGQALSGYQGGVGSFDREQTQNMLLGNQLATAADQRAKLEQEAAGRRRFSEAIAAAQARKAVAETQMRRSQAFVDNAGPNGAAAPSAGDVVSAGIGPGAAPARLTADMFDDPGVMRALMEWKPDQAINIMTRDRSQSAPVTRTIDGVLNQWNGSQWVPLGKGRPESAPTTRNIRQGNQIVNQEWDAAAGAWRNVGSGDVRAERPERVPTIGSDFLLPLLQKQLRGEPLNPNERAALDLYARVSPLDQMIRSATGAPSMPPSAIPSPGAGAPGPQGSKAVTLQQARDALAAGAKRSDIDARLKSMGIDPSELR